VHAPGENTARRPERSGRPVRSECRTDRPGRPSVRSSTARGGEGKAGLRPIRADVRAPTRAGLGQTTLQRGTAGCRRRCAARRRSVYEPDREHDFTREQWLRNRGIRAGVLAGYKRKEDGAAAPQRPGRWKPPAHPEARGERDAGCSLDEDDAIISCVQRAFSRTGRRHRSQPVCAYMGRDRARPLRREKTVPIG